MDMKIKNTILVLAVCGSGIFLSACGKKDEATVPATGDMQKAATTAAGDAKAAATTASSVSEE